MKTSTKSSTSKPWGDRGRGRESRYSRAVAKSRRWSDADTPDNDHLDSHMWLDPVSAQQEVLNIAAALAAVDPANGDYYRSNAAKYNQELARLDQEYRQTLAKLPRREIVTSHAAFGYLAKRYNLRQVAIMGLSPDSEPTPEKMAKVVTFCRTHNVKYHILRDRRQSQTVGDRRPGNRGQTACAESRGKSDRGRTEAGEKLHLDHAGESGQLAASPKRINSGR